MPVLETREYALFYKKLLRLFGLYYFKDDTKITKFLRDTWMWFIASVFLLTSVQALILLLGRSEFDLKRDSFGVLLVCKSEKNVVCIMILLFVFLFCSCESWWLLSCYVLLLSKRKGAQNFRRYE